MRTIVPIIFAVTLTLHGWAQQKADRPNILWIVSEDTSPLMGCYGDTFATTPAIDKLAREGVLYENAFASAPACAPSRSTLITGMLASSLGTENMRSKYPVPDFIKFFPAYLRKAGYYTSNNAKEDYNTVMQPDAWNQSDRNATYKNRNPTQPFFAVFNLGVTHESKIHRKVDQLNHDPNKVPLPPYHPRTPEMEHDWALFYDNMEAMDKQVGKLLRQLEADGLSDNTIVFYFSDHGGVLPRSKRYVFDAGLRVPLIIRFPEKYKSLAPAPAGSRTDRIVSFEDFAPTILNLAGAEIPDYMQGEPFLGEGASDTEKTFARAFRGRIDKRDDVVRSVRSKAYRYVRNYSPHKIYGQHTEYQWQAPSIVSWEEAFKKGDLSEVQAAFWREKPTEELYEIASDPHNVRNLAGDEAYSSVLKQMREQNRREILETRDTGFIPEAMKSDISRSGTVYAFASSAEYPLERILETAEMATSRDPRLLKSLVRRLSDKNPIVRYWAVTAWIVAEGKGADAQSALRPLLADDSPTVRVAAAEALYKQGDRTDVLPVLRDLLQNDNLYVRLYALTALEGMGQDARTILPAIRKAAHTGSDRKGTAQRPWKADHDVKVARTLVETLSKGS